MIGKIFITAFFMSITLDVDMQEDDSKLCRKVMTAKRGDLLSNDAMRALREIAHKNTATVTGTALVDDGDSIVHIMRADSKELVLESKKRRNENVNGNSRGCLLGNDAMRILRKIANKNTATMLADDNESMVHITDDDGIEEQQACDICCAGRVTSNSRAIPSCIVAN